MCGGGSRSSAGNVLFGRRACIAQPAGVRRGCVGVRKCSGRACRCEGASEGLRWGMGREVGEECIAQPAGVRLGCVGERKCSGRACRCAGTGEGLRRGRRCEVGGRASALRGERKCSGGRVAVRGRAKGFGGEWAMRSADLTHIRRSGSRVRVLLYIRLPCPRREIAAMGPKDAPCEHPSPA